MQFKRSRARSWSWRALIFVLAALPILAAVYQQMRAGLALEQVPDDFESATYIRSPFIALSHFVPGIVYLLLAPLQFNARFRARWPQWHRGLGVVVILAALSAGLTALWMNTFFPGRVIGGWLKYSAVLVFGTGFVVAPVLGVLALVRCDFARHRAWMVRAFAIGLGGGTQRLMLLPIYFIQGGLSDLVIGLSQWACFGVNLFVAELILQRDRFRRPEMSASLDRRCRFG